MLVGLTLFMSVAIITNVLCSYIHTLINLHLKLIQYTAGAIIISLFGIIILTTRWWLNWGGAVIRKCTNIMFMKVLPYIIIIIMVLHTGDSGATELASEFIIILL